MRRGRRGRGVGGGRLVGGWVSRVAGWWGGGVVGGWSKGGGMGLGTENGGWGMGTGKWEWER